MIPALELLELLTGIAFLLAVGSLGLHALRSP